MDKATGLLIIALVEAALWLATIILATWRISALEHQKPGCLAKALRLPADELAEEVRRLEELGYTVTHRTPDRTKEVPDGDT